MRKHARLIAVLVFAVMLLILGLLVASVTSCAPMASTVQAAQPTATLIPHDGSLYHPWYVDAASYGNNERWDVLTFRGHEKWNLISFLWTIKPGQYIWYSGAEYQVSTINRQALTMSVALLGN